MSGKPGRPRIRGDLTKAQWRRLRRVKSKPERGTTIMFVDNVPVKVDVDYRLRALRSAATRIEKEVAALKLLQPIGRKPSWIRLRLRTLEAKLAEVRAQISERVWHRTRLMAIKRQKMIDQINCPPVAMPRLPDDWRQR